MDGGRTMRNLRTVRGLTLVCLIFWTGVFYLACHRPTPPVSDPLPPPVLPADVPNVPSSPADVPTWSLDRLLATAMGLPVIANITVRVGAQYAGYKIRYGPAMSLKHAQGAEPPHYVESRDVQTYVYLLFEAYDAADAEIGRWRLVYGVGQGFTGVRVSDILIHGNYYGVDIAMVPGDVNSSYAVDADDVEAVERMNGQPVTSDNCRFDVTLDGYINSIDRAMVKGRAQ